MVVVRRMLDSDNLWEWRVASDPLETVGHWTDLCFWFRDGLTGTLQAANLEAGNGLGCWPEWVSRNFGGHDRLERWHHIKDHDPERGSVRAWWVVDIDVLVPEHFADQHGNRRTEVLFMCEPQPVWDSTTAIVSPQGWYYSPPCSKQRELANRPQTAVVSVPLTTAPTTTEVQVEQTTTTTTSPYVHPTLPRRVSADSPPFLRTDQRPRTISAVHFDRTDRTLTMRWELTDRRAPWLLTEDGNGGWFYDQTPQLGMAVQLAVLVEDEWTFPSGTSTSDRLTVATDSFAQRVAYRMWETGPDGQPLPEGATLEGCRWLIQHDLPNVSMGGWVADVCMPDFY